MSLDDYKITEKEKQEATKYFLNLIHSGERYKAIKYYKRLDGKVRDYIKRDASGNWELINSFKEFEAWITIEVLRFKYIEK